MVTTACLLEEAPADIRGLGPVYFWLGSCLRVGWVLFTGRPGPARSWVLLLWAWALSTCGLGPVYFGRGSCLLVAWVLSTVGLGPVYWSSWDR